MTLPTGEGTTVWLDAAVELLGRAGRLGSVRVQGESMRPTLPPGTRILVDFAPGPPRVGDVLLFRQGGVLVVHRFLARVRPRDGVPRLRTRGDGAAALDPPLAPGAIAGRAVAVDRGGGWRSLEGPAARAYAALVAAHGHAFAAAGVAAAAGAGPRARDGVLRADRFLLRLADRALFRLVHRRVPAPTGL